MADDSEGLGWKFGVWSILVALGVGLGGILLFLLVGAAWVKWGGLAALIFFGLLLLVVAWFYDRKNAKRYDASEY